jgi:hypothetical protein
MKLPQNATSSIRSTTSPTTSNRDLVVTIRALKDWVQKFFPSINNQTVAGYRVLDALMMPAICFCIELQAKVLGSDCQIDQAQARQLIQLLGMVAGAIERHSQGTAKPGYGISLIPYLTEMLVKLAPIAQHPPVGTAYTVWIWNELENPLTYTCDPQEVCFHRVTQTTFKHHQQSCNALRSLCLCTVPLASPDAAELIQHAADNTEVTLADYRHLQQEMTPEFFMSLFRVNYPSFPLAGIEWGGVNAANLAPQMQLDFLIGTTNEQYSKETVSRRFRYLPEEEEEALKADMGLPSLTKHLVSRLGMTESNIQQIDGQSLTKQIVELPSNLWATYGAYKNLFKNTARLTGFHMGLIHSHLIEAAKKLTPDELNRMAVRPTHGTGGQSHDGTWAIARMRTDHPVAKKLHDAIPTDWARLAKRSQ